MNIPYLLFKENFGHLTLYWKESAKLFRLTKKRFEMSILGAAFPPFFQDYYLQDSELYLVFGLLSLQLVSKTPHNNSRLRQFNILSYLTSSDINREKEYIS